MRSLFRIALIALLLSSSVQATSFAAQRPITPPAHSHWAIEIHGGAFVLDRKSMTPYWEKRYRASLRTALDAGSTILRKGGSSLDAVEAVVKIMEDDPLFNAGRGAVFTANGKIELDAAIMDGATLKAGSVAAVMHTRHPVSLARAVMEQSPHVMLIGDGADHFGAEHGLQQVDQSFFFTERRWQELVRQLRAEGRPIPARPRGVPPAPSRPVADFEPLGHKFGTVGAVARDSRGNLAVATSTGGIQAKMYGRVGDSPIIGAGTYASNQSCAVSATGQGEYFIRLTIAREICALVQYKGMPLQRAADEVIHRQLTGLGGQGGVIAVAPDGQTAWSFNTEGMYRARMSDGAKPLVEIYRAP